MNSRWTKILLGWSLTTTLLLFVFTGTLQSAEPPKKENRWEKTIQRFEAGDAKSPPKAGGILFIGSSSIRGWKLGEFFSDLSVINRGFGGSQIVDSTQFAERIVFPYKPKTIVLYAGDNDVAAGKSPKQVAADYGAFVAKVQAALPNTKIVYIAIKPSIKRWALVEKMREANRLIRTATEKDSLQAFVDIDKPMIGADGRPRKELFLKDGLHLNADGYKLWAKLVRAELGRNEE
jgi:lysophospholipase L1-like esterase